MIRRFMLIMLLLGLIGCAVSPVDQDGGIGGTGTPLALMAMH